MKKTSIFAGLLGVGLVLSLNGCGIFRHKPMKYEYKAQTYDTSYEVCTAEVTRKVDSTRVLTEKESNNSVERNRVKTRTVTEEITIDTLITIEGTPSQITAVLGDTDQITMTETPDAFVEVHMMPSKGLLAIKTTPKKKEVPVKGNKRTTTEDYQSETEKQSASNVNRVDSASHRVAVDESTKRQAGTAASTSVYEKSKRVPIWLWLLPGLLIIAAGIWFWRKR